jgi:hypothetical protein
MSLSSEEDKVEFVSMISRIQSNKFWMGGKNSKIVRQRNSESSSPSILRNF